MRTGPVQCKQQLWPSVTPSVPIQAACASAANEAGRDKEALLCGLLQALAGCGHRADGASGHAAGAGGACGLPAQAPRQGSGPPRKAGVLWQPGHDGH